MPLCNDFIHFGYAYRATQEIAAGQPDWPTLGEAPGSPCAQREAGDDVQTVPLCTVNRLRTGRSADHVSPRSWINQKGQPEPQYIFGYCRCGTECGIEFGIIIVLVEPLRLKSDGNPRIGGDTV
jgi:hypothetical protein